MAVNSNPPVLIDPSMDESHKDSFINQNFLNLANSLNPFLLSDGTNNRLLIGKDSAGNYVVKISKAGFDAYDGADANLVFNSANDVFKIVSSGTSTLTYGAGDTVKSITITHNLGYIPAVQVYLTSSPLGGEFYFPLPSSTYYARSGGFIVFNAYTYFTTTSTTLKIYVATGTASASYAGDWAYKYYCLQETAN